MIRAFNPRPIAQSNAEANEFKDKVLRIIEAEVIPLKLLSLQVQSLSKIKRFVILQLVWNTKLKKGSASWQKCSFN